VLIYFNLRKEDTYENNININKLISYKYVFDRIIYRILNWIRIKWVRLCTI